MKFLTLLLSINFLFAGVVDIYRFEGIKKVQEKLEAMLQSKYYWETRLKNKSLKFGYFETPRFILFCNKRNKVLSVYNVKDNRIRRIMSFNSLIVGKLGDKFQRGDLRTPIGDYKLIDKIKPKDTFYGPLAFVTSYPNTFDKLQHKNGYGIWIHGRPIDGSKRPPQSKGCIVLKNSNLLTLSKIINYKKAELLISEQPLYAKKEDIAQILAMLYQWRAAWRESNLEKYSKFYDKDFKSSKGYNLESFLNYKRRVFNMRKNENVEIFFSDISIIPYQNSLNKIIYKVKFYEKYLADTFKWEGNKEIYLIKRDKNFKIFIE